MTDDDTTLDLDALLASANPLDAARAVTLPLADAEAGDCYGRPLEGDVDSGLGCPSLGIPLS